MNKRRIRINESHLNRVIKEAICRVLNESDSNSEECYRAVSMTYHITELSPEGDYLETEEITDIAEYDIIEDSPGKLVKRIAEYDGYTNYNISISDDGWVDIICCIDENRQQLTDEEIMQWRRGRRKAYNLEISFRVAKQNILSKSELFSAGIG